MGYANFKNKNVKKNYLDLKKQANQLYKDSEKMQKEFVDIYKSHKLAVLDFQGKYKKYIYSKYKSFEYAGKVNAFKTDRVNMRIVEFIEKGYYKRFLLEKQHKTLPDNVITSFVYENEDKFEEINEIITCRDTFCSVYNDTDTCNASAKVIKNLEKEFRELKEEYTELYYNYKNVNYQIQDIEYYLIQCDKVKAKTEFVELSNPNKINFEKFDFTEFISQDKFKNRNYIEVFENGDYEAIDFILNQALTSAIY